MLTRDLHVHGVEQRGLFLAQLPQRLARLASRGERLGREGWDINTLYLLADDAAGLASACRELDAGDLAEALDALSSTLQPLFEPPHLPDTTIAAAIDARIGAVRDQPLPAAAKASASHAGVVVPGPIDDDGFPLLVVPPADYWLRFARAEPAPAQATEPEPLPPTAVAASTAIEPSPQVTEATIADARADTRPSNAAVMRKTAYHLGRGDAPGVDLDRYLATQGYELTVFDSVDELKELLVALPPHLVVVDAAFEIVLDEIGALVKRARADVSERIWLVALAEDAELSKRLRAVRAGCDAFIALPASADDVIARVGELIETERTNPFRIMIVEDDRSQTLFAESILRKAGMETLAVTEGLAALDELDRFRPELILMDLYMPDVDGMELTALIREREAFITTPIVFLSGESDADKHFEALNAGGDDFLSKPIRPKHLISAVTNRVRRSRQISSRRAAPAMTTPAPAGDGTIARDTLLSRFAECLAMEDARSRAGGLVAFVLDDPDALRARLGTPRFERIVADVAGVLVGGAGPRDLVARDGSNGFLMLNTDRDVALLERHANELRERVTRANFALADGVSILIDAGIAPFRDSRGDALAMLEAATRAVADARAKSRRGTFVAQEAVPAVDDDDALARLIRFALDGSGLQLLFQPIVSLHGEEHEQFQALLRLQGDDGRQHAAAEIVPVAERAGFIGEIDQWVFAQCVAMIVERTRNGRAPRLFLSQSLASVRDDARVAWMTRVLEDNGVRGDSVALEVSVTQAEAAPDEVARFGSAVKPLGIALVLAGFEAGETGERLLDSIPADLVKLSPRYVRVDMASVRDELRELVAFAHERSVQVIAPRVEDARGAAALWTAGVDFIQGNFVQRAGHDLHYDFHAAVM